MKLLLFCSILVVSALGFLSLPRYCSAPQYRIVQLYARGAKNRIPRAERVSEGNIPRKMKRKMRGVNLTSENFAETVFTAEFDGICFPIEHIYLKVILVLTRVELVLFFQCFCATSPVVEPTKRSGSC
jgi:hypothetical protein